MLGFVDEHGLCCRPCVFSPKSSGLCPPRGGGTERNVAGAARRRKGKERTGNTFEYATAVLQECSLLVKVWPTSI